MDQNVRDNRELHRYEILDGQQVAAFAVYRPAGELVDFVHTETVAGYERRGFAATLVRSALEDVGHRGLQVRPTCPFVRSYVARHAEFRGLVPESERARYGLTGDAGDTPE